MRENGAAPLQALAITLENWQESIARMWCFVRNNGIIEGFHRKMKPIQRRAYGFKNFENYRLRVIAKCAEIPSLTYLITHIKPQKPPNSQTVV